MSMEQELLDVSLGRNLSSIKNKLNNCSDVNFRQIKIHHQMAYLIYIEGLTNVDDIQVHVIRDLFSNLKKEPVSLEVIRHEIVSIGQVSTEKKINVCVDLILRGNTVLLIDGLDEALLFQAKNFETRSISEPESESAIRGPREGFIESIAVNTSLIRRKIRSTDFKVKMTQVGEYTQTDVGLVYIEGLASDELVKEVEERINRIEADSILETGYIEEFIEDDPWSIFPQVQVTERPDTVAANLLEGRVAVIVDGTPFVIILPATFWQQFQASEDYYERFHISIFLRILRFAFLWIALLLPSLYIATTTYHHEMIPTNLLLSISASREAIPFPALVEAFIMELSFEALREAGVRLPKTIGQAVSILGALVIGTAAVEAGIVSAPMVIIVSLTGIASFTVPKFSLAISIRLLRFPMMILAGVFGLFGIVVGVIAVTTHLCKLRSFGVPYFSPVAPLSLTGLKDVLIRLPWWQEDVRPNQFVKQNRRRQSHDLYPSPEQDQ
ncbi:spore germination protein [Halalkalibacter urbisdiaboli]|uniref:spore germination protein n=1 Tax=Halalkalibacter urbisdiaboli TaxID=1960589 RepID=UPI001FD9FA18|nr:spore germination protein [Halalkalibacter urbisdiaboli]